MHRLIVMSATYRQSSKHAPDLREKDPQNSLLARQHRLRLDAEIIRDAALVASGLLDAQARRPRRLSAATAGDIRVHAEQSAVARKQGSRPLSPRHVHLHLAAKPASRC